MTQNIILDEGGSNELTVNTTNIEENGVKQLQIITPPNSTANAAAGPKTSKIVDLQKFEERYTVDGYIATADKTKFKTLVKQGGIFKMKLAGTNININIEKYTITEVAEDSDQTNTPREDYKVKFTCVVGEDI